MVNQNKINIFVIIFALFVCVYIYLDLNSKENFADGDVMDISTIVAPTPTITAGLDGIQGNKGQQGIAGKAGINGTKGDKGVKGSQGIIDLSVFTFTDSVKSSDASKPSVPSKMILPSNLCIGTECITGGDFDNIFKTPGCKVYLWDAPPTYRDYSSINNINTTVNPPNIVNPAISWRTMPINGDLSYWGCGMLNGPCTAWHAGVFDNVQWQMIYTEPKLSQKVKGIRILSRRDAYNWNGDYIIAVYVTYKPLDGNTLDPALINRATGEVVVVPPGNQTVPADVRTTKDTLSPSLTSIDGGNSYYFGNSGAWGGIEIHFDKPIECKYVKMVYTIHTRVPACRSGLYLCL